MRKNLNILGKAAESERQHRYFFGATSAERQAMRYRSNAGELAKLYPNVYARQSYLESLSPRERSMHLIRTLQLMHPHWQFACLSAAAVYGFEYPYALDAHSPVFIATTWSKNQHHAARLERIHIADPPMTIRDGIRVTTPERTLADCVHHYSFVQSLGMFDSALRQGVTTFENIRTTLPSLDKKDAATVMNALRYADPASENGGESLCRATIIEAGFAVPRLQQEFVDPYSPTSHYRVDFFWPLRDGRKVILEYDGMEKYTNPTMTQNHSTRSVVHDERHRESVLSRFATVIRTDYREVLARQPLINKLAQAGIPPAEIHL
ncbi:hypothetical protein PT282_06115 [Bifidobacterium sp. ESL0763]|uniref:hypothetical protein n=1 Tax=Bifidobacterium sp. ESL0763 TaxID=2983227 RepID=UPI0023F89D22|nr:hypothetical protein [Bifidobacterium sp. ESL0763]MDF7664234.1 hypothetical protein [Bifidobacterium sp. ESL0763]